MQLWLHIAYIKLKCVKSQASPDTRPLSSQASPDPCPLSSQASPDHLHARIESGIARPSTFKNRVRHRPTIYMPESGPREALTGHQRGFDWAHVNLQPAPSTSTYNPPLPHPITSFVDHDCSLASPDHCNHACMIHIFQLVEKSRSR